MIPDGVADLIVILTSTTDNTDQVIFPLLFVVILLETGFPPMIWLPGDSLLFLSGLLAAGGILDIYSLLIIFIIAAFIGYQVNFVLGKKIGLPLIKNHFSRIVTEKDLIRSEEFYRRWGNAAITIGRFIPVIRTMTPFLAGVSRMNPRHFMAYNILGALIWPPVVCGFGYFCGVLPWLSAYRDIIVTIVSVIFFLSILLSCFLILISWVRTR